MKSLRAVVHLPNAGRFYIDGAWVEPSTDATTKIVSGAEEHFMRFALAAESDMLSAIAAARRAHDEGPWRDMLANERAEFLREIADGIREREELLAEIWSIEVGSVFTCSRELVRSVAAVYESFAEMADAYPLGEPALLSREKGVRLSLAREPVGVVGAIILPKSPVLLTSIKLASAMLSGCSVILSAAPECPGTLNVMAEIVDAIAFPEGVLNVVTADRSVAELLVNDRRVDRLEIANQKVVRFSGAA